MSYKNYDVEKGIVYSETYKHYIPSYKIAVPYAWRLGVSWETSARYNVAISFDEESEQELEYGWYVNEGGAYPPVPYWNENSYWSAPINTKGVFTKAYFRNTQRGIHFSDPGPAWTTSNCYVQPVYTTKAPFEVQFNSTGFAANQNPWFKCSTIQKNTYKQYEWTSATVYYKKSSDSSYQSVSGTVSGTWSDVRIDTNITLEDGYTYDIYIAAVGDDGSTATTPVAQFTTTDAASITSCISPVGAFLQGEAVFVWSHTTEYGTPQHAYDLQYSLDNGSSWTTVKSHEVTQTTTTSLTLTNAGVYKWRVRTYNSNDVAGEWAEASFVNNVPATPPTNLSVNTKGRPTVSWASVSQTAYQIQFLQNNTVVYDSGAIYSTQNSHFVNQYFNDERSYTVRLRVYNALGETSEWVETGYQQPSVNDVSFTISNAENGGTVITVEQSDVFAKYYLLRNGKPIAEITGGSYTDYYAVGQNNYSVVAVTSGDQSDIQTKGHISKYPHATLITPQGQQILINKRVDEAYQINTNNEADINKANFIGDALPTHYSSDLRLKSFEAACWDDQNFAESLLGQIVYYADNFGNGGFCIVKAYEKTDNFIKNSKGIYANEVSLELEVTNYDDTIKYPL